MKKAIYPFQELEYAGRIISAGRKGSVVEVLMSGNIIPKKQETEYRQKLKQELMLNIFSCLGDMFGYDVEVTKK